MEMSEDISFALHTLIPSRQSTLDYHTKKTCFRSFSQAVHKLGVLIVSARLLQRIQRFTAHKIRPHLHGDVGVTFQETT